MATKEEQVYACQVCTNVVKVLDSGVGTLVCCNKPMVLQGK
ncbi:MAG: desulfoferrodoxin FeS4 iron-binding domain-containing protein [Bacillota bacterium]